MRRAGLTLVLVFGAALAVPASGALAQEALYQKAGEEAEAVGVEHEPPEEQLGHGGHETSFWDLWTPSNYELYGPIINFLFLLLIVVGFGGPALKKFLVARRQEIAEGLEEAQRLKKEAEAKYDEYAGRLERLDEEMERIRQEMVKAGEAERDRIVADAEAKAARLRRDTEFVIEQQMKQLREDLTQEAVRAAVDAAEKVLTEKITADDQQRLAKQYLGIVGKEVRASMQPTASKPTPTGAPNKAEGGPA